VLFTVPLPPPAASPTALVLSTERELPPGRPLDPLAASGRQPLPAGALVVGAQ
jgi:hypothetical protein